MKLTERVSVLAIEARLANGPGIIHPAVLHDEGHVVLVDAGLPGLLDLFRKAFDPEGIPFDRIGTVILTHSDMDHLGGLAALIGAAGRRVEVLAHANEKPYIECEVPPLRLSQMEAGLSTIQGERFTQMKALVDNLRANYRNLRVEVSRTVLDGEVLPFCGGVTVIGTPGHTPGHISLYIPDGKILIAGDMLNVENGALVRAPAFTTFNPGEAENSLRKLTRFDIETVVCYHGGVYRGNANARIAELAS